MRATGLALAAWAVLCAQAASAVPLTPDAEAFFETRVRPVLAQNCYSCHGPKIQHAGLRLDSRAALLKGTDAGQPVLVPGQPDRSSLIQVLQFNGKVKMPPAGKLTEAQIADLTRWVATGAPWPEPQIPSSKFQAPNSAIRNPQSAIGHWAFQPVRQPKLPSVKDRKWVRSPVDAFVLAKLEAKGLKPSPPADKRTLIRRATFDLIGLPPTPDEITAFLNDRSPEAFPRVVDRLLASPRYGERWGRHWLDVVRYADTAGNTADLPVPQAHRYRDYVIRAYNEDRPYDQFLREQVAGDLLGGTTEAEKEERTIATGYLAVGRRFSLLGERGPDHLELEDVIDTVGRSVLGLSLSCARCHDHKFDPVSQQDYYAFYGIFKSTRFPFPGTEGNARQKAFVPLASGGEAYAVAEGAASNARIQRGGDPSKAGEEAARGFLTVLGGQRLPPDVTGSGRLQLAGWLTEVRNPLTARVMVNRIWQGHFGRGLVGTPNDFGVRGRRPTHPELLDFLAAVFTAPAESEWGSGRMGEWVKKASPTRWSGAGWSLKRLHRLIMLSSTYQLAGAGPAAGTGPAALRDPNNEWWWKYPRRRLDAEAIRDAMLAVSGELDLTMGGPHPFPPQSDWSGYSQHNPFIAAYETKRRSVYLMQQRIRKHPFLAMFDGADPNASTPGRLLTTTPIQALFMMNDPFVHRAADRLADRMIAAGPDDPRRVQAGYFLALGRRPTPEETGESAAYLQRVRGRLAQSNLAEDARARAAWASLARVLFASNEFLYVD